MMNNEFYFSPSRLGFYRFSHKSLYELSPNGWPADAIPIAEESYRSLLNGAAEGKNIVLDGNGNPILAPAD
ncbi:hypothetical protein ACLPHD_12370 [Serratia odorifera]|uniref:hypothetical protein n=1 Tax=Serratia odorifera TaxID=618 RepID=UPI003D2DFEFC